MKMDRIQSTSLNLFPTLVTEVDLNPILDAADVSDRIFDVCHEAVEWGLFGNSVSTLPRVQPTYGKPSLRHLDEMPKYNILAQTNNALFNVYQEALIRIFQTRFLTTQ